MAPCSSCFNPHIFCFERMSTDQPPSATFAISHGTASPPGAALWGPQGCGPPLAWAEQWAPHCQPQLFVPYSHQGRAVVPACPGLPPSLPSYCHLERQYTQHRGDISLDSDVPMEEGTIQGGNIPLHSDIPPIPSATLRVQAIRDTVVIPASAIVLPEEVLLEEARRRLDCSLRAVGISQDGPSSIPMPRD
ncbi:hypothetical protein Y956_06026, partial [Nipponia nippon]